MAAKTSTQERRVKHAMFTYHESIKNPVDPDGADVLVERIAYHGQVVSLMPHDIERGETHGAFFTDDEPQTGDGAQYPSQFTHDELVLWLKRDKPNVQTITGLANSDPDPRVAAEMLIAAENEATENDPREDLLAGLESIKQGAETEEHS